MTANKIPDGLTANVTSAGADRNATCILFRYISSKCLSVFTLLTPYSEQYCKGNQSVPIMHGGYANLSDVDFDKMTMSFKCFDNTGVRDSRCTKIDG